MMILRFTFTPAGCGDCSFMAANERHTKEKVNENFDSDRKSAYRKYVGIITAHGEENGSEAKLAEVKEFAESL